MKILSNNLRSAAHFRGKSLNGLGSPIMLQSATPSSANLLDGPIGALGKRSSIPIAFSSQVPLPCQLFEWMGLFEHG